MVPGRDVLPDAGRPNPPAAYHRKGLSTRAPGAFALAPTSPENPTILRQGGAGGLAQQDHVVRADHHPVAAIEQLLPGGAGVRHRAHRLAGSQDDVLGALHEAAHVRMVQLLEPTDRAREVVHADEHHVDALDGADLGRVLDRGRQLICSTISRFGFAFST